MSRLSEKIRQQVKERADSRCEYCGVLEIITHFDHQADHIVPPRHGGSDELDNLACACFRCNNAKGTDIATYDFDTQSRVFLYDPRQHVWTDYFRLLESGVIEGLNPVGRATARLLQMNVPKRVEMRRVLLEADLWQIPGANSTD